MPEDKGFSRYDVYTTSGSIYCYRDTNTLINLLGITDSVRLKEIEADIFAIRQSDMLSHPIPVCNLKTIIEI